MSTALKTRLFVKQGGRVRGPFSIRSLQSMQRRRKIARDTLVSDNRCDGWATAESLAEVFPDNGWERRTPTTNEEMQWYYAIAGRKNGPVSFEELQQLVATGQVNPFDHVLSETMSDWMCAEDVGGLDFGTSASVGGDRRSIMKYIIIGTAAFLLLAVTPAAWYLVSDHLEIKETARLASEEEQRTVDDLKERQAIAAQREHEMALAQIQAEADVKKAQEEAEKERRRREDAQKQLAATEALRDAIEGGNGSNGSGSPNPEGYSVGDYVQNQGWLQSWIGRIVATNGETCRIRITYASRGLIRRNPYENRVGETVDLLSGEFKRLKAVSADAAMKGYK